MSDAFGSIEHAEPTRGIMRWIIAALYFVAGIIHLARPEPFLAITPDWVPYPGVVIFLSGLFELAVALALLTRRFRRAAGIAMAVYALCVWPANFKHAIDSFAMASGDWRWWYHVPRLALQPVIVWWALFSASVIDWPLRRR
ncbi:MAG: hypothetical protein Q7T86_01340 [Hyphomicrobiaceae bacterium]|nr:hypothetical protein [Hyphomicrobiaceae bacterium]